MARLRVLVAIALASTAACLLCAPTVVNGDGLGYLKATLSGNLYPGHVGYVPLLRLLRVLVHAGPRAIDGLTVARALCAVGAGVAVLAFGGAVGWLVSDGGATIAATGLAASYGTLAAGCDVETYAPALALLCTCLYALARRRAGGPVGWTVAAALALAGACILHVENVLFALPCAIALGRDRRDALVLCGLSGALTLAAYLVAGAGPAWVLGASHGFHYPLHWYTPAVALYGICKALLYSPYPYEASWARVIGHFVPGVIALAALVVIVIARDPERPTRAPLGRAATAAWALPYGAIGVAFFASDQERWVFLLPLFWLTVATVRRRARLALAVAVGLFALNLAVWLPRARDTTWRDRATAAAHDVRPGDLVVSPGHGWDEYIGVYEGPEVGHFPIVFHTAQLGSAARVKDTLAEFIRDARKRGHAIVLVRFDDRDDPMGWKELHPFGITPDNVRTLLPPGKRVRLPSGAERLDPP